MDANREKREAAHVRHAESWQLRPDSSARIPTRKVACNRVGSGQRVHLGEPRAGIARDSAARNRVDGTRLPGDVIRPIRRISRNVDLPVDA